MPALEYVGGVFRAFQTPIMEVFAKMSSNIALKLAPILAKRSILDGLDGSRMSGRYTRVLKTQTLTTSKHGIILILSLCEVQVSQLPKHKPAIKTNIESICPVLIIVKNTPWKCFIVVWPQEMAANFMAKFGWQYNFHLWCQRNENLCLTKTQDITSQSFWLSAAEIAMWLVHPLLVEIHRLK